MGRVAIVLCVMACGCGGVVQNPDAAGDDDDARTQPDACVDDDGDTVCNGADLCPGSDDRIDIDSDGRPDGCDGCPADPTPGCAPVTCIVRFDDQWASQADQGKSPDVAYGAHGIHFGVGTGFGIIDGESNGDSGNWDIEGSNGPAAWGLWPSDHSISWIVPVSSVRIDVLRGHSDVNQSAVAMLGVTQVDTQSVVVVGPFAHQTLAFAGPLDAVTWTHTDYYGIDNIQFTTTTTSGVTCP